MLRTLMLRKELDDKKKALDALRAKDADLEARKIEIEESIEEASTEEEKNVVREAIDAYEAEREAHEQEKTDLDEEVRKLETGTRR